MNFKTILTKFKPIDQNSVDSRYFLVALLVPVIFLLGMTLKPIMTLQFGQSIQLQTQPIDPTDLFRGDYVDLFYDMNQLEVKNGNLEGLPTNYDAESLRGKTVYAILELGADGKTYEVARYSMITPKDGIYLKGSINYAYSNDPSSNKVNLILNIDYGIDRYFIRENSGMDLETASRAGKVLVTMKVLNGFGIVTDLEIQK